MAKSRFEYVRSFEQPDSLLPSTFLVIRIDGKGFHAFSDAHRFEKPNDKKALMLMNEAAKRVMQGPVLCGDCVLAFGESDEYSFVFRRRSTLFARRAQKLVSTVVSLFTGFYVFLWNDFFPNSPLQPDMLPSFDGRIVQYTTETEIRDYVRWRQVDTHINNLYNTCFWALVLKAGRSNDEAKAELDNTSASQKNELLFSKFGINYNKEDPMFRKGSLLVFKWKEPSAIAEQTEETSNESTQEKKQTRPRKEVVVLHEDVINDKWWDEGNGKGLLS